MAGGLLAEATLRRPSFDLSLKGKRDDEAEPAGQKKTTVVEALSRAAPARRTKADCTPAQRRIALKCRRNANALLAFEVFS